MTREYWWYRHEPLEFSAQTSDLPLEAVGAFIRMRDRFYLFGPLPNSVAEIAKIIRAPRKYHTVIEGLLSRFFILTDDGYIDPELVSKLADAKDKTAKRAAAGREGGLAKARNKRQANATDDELANSTIRASNSDSNSPREGSDQILNQEDTCARVIEMPARKMGPSS